MQKHGRKATGTFSAALLRFILPGSPPSFPSRRWWSIGRMLAAVRAAIALLLVAVVLLFEKPPERS